RELRQAVPRRTLLQRPDRARSRAQQRSAAHRCRCPPEERPLVSRAAEASVPRGGPRVLAASRSAPHALGAGVSLTGDDCAGLKQAAPAKQRIERQPEEDEE